MRIDWQAYMDGSLDQNSRDVAERELAENPSARQELQNLKLFVSTVRNAALAEPVSIERLEALMPRSRPEPSARRVSLSNWALGFAAAAVLARR